MLLRGTIDFPDQQLVERDFYSSNEELRDSTIFLGSNGCSVIESRQATLVDPHTFLIKSESSRYSYVSRDNIEFKQDPVLNGMILAVRFENSSATRATFTYLTRGLFWTPRYDVVILNEHCKPMIPMNIFLYYRVIEFYFSCDTSSIGRYKQ